MTELQLKRLKDLAFCLAKASFKHDRYYGWTVNQLHTFFKYATDYPKWNNLEDVYDLISEYSTEVVDYAHLMGNRLERAKLDRFVDTRSQSEDCTEEELEAYDNLRFEIADRVSNAFSCCLHIAFDVVTEPWVGGVLGFTVGDLKRAYPKGFPNWFKEKFTVDLDSLPSTEYLTL
jgi:hypothetical protein